MEPFILAYLRQFPGRVGNGTLAEHLSLNMAQTKIGAKRRDVWSLLSGQAAIDKVNCGVLWGENAELSTKDIQQFRVSSSA
jgi:hypothetical protein